jgi:hypothetical protein
MFTNIFGSLIPYFAALLAIGTSLGTLWAMRKSYTKQAIELSKQTGEIQDRIINAQKAENEGLNRRIDECEKKIEHLEGMLETTADLLKQKGFTLTIEGDTVTLEEDGKVSSIRKKPRPAKPTLRPVPKKDTP